MNLPIRRNPASENSRVDPSADNCYNPNCPHNINTPSNTMPGGTAMEVTIRPKNFKLSSGIESQIRRRVERLPRHLDQLESVEVILSQQPTRLTPQRFHYVAQLTVHTSHNLLRSEVADPELLTAVDQVMSRLTRQIERFKGRHYRRHKGSPGLGKSSAEIANKGPVVEAPSMVEMVADL